MPVVSLRRIRLGAGASKDNNRGRGESFPGGDAQRLITIGRRHRESLWRLIGWKAADLEADLEADGSVVLATRLCTALLTALLTGLLMGLLTGLLLTDLDVVT